MKHGIVCTSFVGRVTSDQIADYAVQLKAERYFDAAFAEVIDLTELVSIDLDFEAIDRWAKFYDPFLPASKRALVAPKSSPASGVARMYEALHSGPAQIFSSLEAARGWLCSAA